MRPRALAAGRKKATATYWYEPRQPTRAEELAMALWYESAEGKWWLELGLAMALNWPYWDPSDCEHGCNGGCVTAGGERCNFTCHPAAG